MYIDQQEDSHLFSNHDLLRRGASGFASGAAQQENGRANANLPEEKRNGTHVRSFPGVGTSVSYRDGLNAVNHFSGEPAAQLMKFSRFESYGALTNWWYNDTEKALLEKEETARELVDSLVPYVNSEEKGFINHIFDQFERIEKGTFGKGKYETVDKALDQVIGWVNGIKPKLNELGKEYGAYNLDLIVHEKNTKENEYAQLTIGFVVKAMSMLPKYMQTEKNKLVLKNSLIPGISGKGYNPNGLQKPDYEFAQSRCELLLRNFGILQERIIQNWKTLQTSFGLEGELLHIHLTGSDYHNAGQQVAIIESTGGQKAIYKPRSTQPDQALSGTENSVFQQLNELSGGELHLPTIHTSEKKDDDGTYSFVSFVNHMEVKTEEQVAAYYRDLGQLTVVSKLVGVTDLHLENIIAGSVPTIIDGETSFLPFVMLAKKINATEIKGSLLTFLNQSTGSTDNNYFYTPDEKKAWEKLSPQKRMEQKVTAFEHYAVKQRAQDLQGLGNYWVEFLTGIMDAMYWLSNKKEVITNIILGQLENLRMTRVVPVATQSFRDSMRAYYMILDGENPKDAKNELARMGGTVMIELEKFAFLLNDNAIQIIMKGLLIDFGTRDTPIFHYHPNTNELVYHEMKIGMHPEMIDPEKLVSDNIEWLLEFGSHNILGEIQHKE